MTQTIMLGVIIALLLVLIIARFSRSSEIKNLERSVLTKKLKLNDKLLDKQLETSLDMGVLLGGTAPSEETSKKEIIGFKK